MTAAARWPPVTRVLADFLADLGACGTETPLTLQADVPYIRLTRTGGADDRMVTDSAVVSVDVFAADADTADDLAETIRQRLLTGLPASTAHGVIDWAATETGPQPLAPTDTDNLRLAVASYRVSARLQEGAS